VARPAEGGEACRYSELGRSATDYPYHVSQLSGTWFLLAQTARHPDVMLDDCVASVRVHSNNYTVSATVGFANRFYVYAIV